MNQTAFPKTVEYRGASATIYLPNARNTTRYEVRFFDVDGVQQRLTFASCEAAKELAEAAVREIAQNRSNSRTAIYSWLRKFEEEGWDALVERIAESPSGATAGHGWPGCVGMTTVIVIAHDEAVAEGFQLKEGILPKVIVKTWARHHPPACEILNERVAGRIAK
jgi:Helix-turn-helix domain